MEITKSSIIKAFKKENLEPGAYVQESDLPIVGKCGVCAVGSVFRYLKIPNSTIRTLVSDFYFTEAGYLFERLDDAFESEASKHQNLNKRRSIAIKFVEKNFPKKVEIPDELIKAAREEGFKHLVKDSHFNAKYEGYKHPYPRKKSPKSYSKEERRHLVSHFTRWALSNLDKVRQG